MTLTRRTLLAAAAGGLGTALSGCAVLAPAQRGPTTNADGAAEEVAGPFSWRRAEGARLTVLLHEHAVARTLVQRLAAFTVLTGIEVTPLVVSAETYFDTVTRALVSGQTHVDVFMTGAHAIWQYAPPGWMEDLSPWLGNQSATSGTFDASDFLPNVAGALRWDPQLGSPVGSGPRWALPLGWEATGVVYRPDVLDRLGLRPPGSFAELADVAAAASDEMRRQVPDGYGLAVRGVPGWTSLDAGFITQYLREGGEDFTNVNGRLAPAVDSAASVNFHTRWTEMIRRSGPPAWAAQTAIGCASHVRNGRAAMAYDTVGATLPGRWPAAAAPPLAWAPGPGGPGGRLDSSMIVWGLAVSSRSLRKQAAWLFLQWATGAEHARTAARRGSIDPARMSAARDPAYRSFMAGYPGYLDTVDAVRDNAQVGFTPQPYFFDATTAWSHTLHRIHDGADPTTALTRLADRFRRRA